MLRTLSQPLKTSIEYEPMQPQHPSRESAFVLGGFGDGHRRMRLLELLIKACLWQTALFVFLAAAAGTRIVAADLCASRQCATRTRIERVRGRIVRSGRDTTLSQPQFDFDILQIAGNREIQPPLNEHSNG